MKLSATITITAIFLEEQSLPQENIYIWAYCVKISNKMAYAITIKRRVIEVFDVVGQRQKIEGLGFGSAEEAIEPKKSFEYVGGILISQPAGMLLGKYIACNEDDEEFEIVIPSVSLDSKYDNHFIQ